MRSLAMIMPGKQVTEAWISLMRAQQLAFRHTERALRQAGLPPYGWYDALWELEKAGEAGLRIHQIEQRMLIAQSNVSRLVDRLDAAGCVLRAPCPKDGRGQFIVITERGRATRAEMWPVYGQAIQEAIGDHVSDDEAETIAKLLRPIIENGRVGSVAREQG